MSKNLVIVESPAKAKKINQFLGKDYIVMASVGHVRDLPPKKLGVDVKKNFEPEYTATTRGKKILKEAIFCKFCRKWLDELNKTINDIDWED